MTSDKSYSGRMTSKKKTQIDTCIKHGVIAKYSPRHVHLQHECLYITGVSPFVFGVDLHHIIFIHHYLCPGSLGSQPPPPRSGVHTCTLPLSIAVCSRRSSCGVCLSATLPPQWLPLYVGDALIAWNPDVAPHPVRSAGVRTRTSHEQLKLGGGGSRIPPD